MKEEHPGLREFQTKKLEQFREHGGAVRDIQERKLESDIKARADQLRLKERSEALASRRQAILAAAHSAAPGTSVEDLIQRAEKILAWIDRPPS
jgi:hypothetical protein